jgi:hypothetical protein
MQFIYNSFEAVIIQVAINRIELCVINIVMNQLGKLIF